MQDGVREEDVKFTELEQILSGLVNLETLVLGIDNCVSLRRCNVIVTPFVCVCACVHIFVVCFILHCSSLNC